MGVVNLVKTLGQSAGPSITGWLAEIDKFWISFVAAGCLKISYDFGMLLAFSSFRGPEDVQSPPQQSRAARRRFSCLRDASMHGERFRGSLMSVDFASS